MGEVLVPSNGSRYVVVLHWRQGERGRGEAILLGYFHGRFHIFNNLISVLYFQAPFPPHVPSSTTLARWNSAGLPIKCKSRMYRSVFLMSTTMSAFDFSNSLSLCVCQRGEDNIGYEAVWCLSCTFTFFWMHVCVCGWWVTSKHCVPRMYYVWQRLTAGWEYIHKMIYVVHRFPCWAHSDGWRCTGEWESNFIAQGHNRSHPL